MFKCLDIGILSLIGDLNFHTKNAGQFTKLLDSFNLQYHATTETHEAVHTVDIINTRKQMSVVKTSYLEA